MPQVASVDHDDANPSNSIEPWLHRRRTVPTVPGPVNTILVFGHSI
jgi:hypothetical protein